MSSSNNSLTDCGCCAGVTVSTPKTLTNRPGLTELAYRVGTHASFFESMSARLSSREYPALAGLNTRALDDPAIALLDAWATVADVLTFYNERNVNEGYLRTATQRRSILEMAQLVGYQLRPGVSASTFLAFSLDDNAKEEALIPKGSRAQSIPGPGELPQSFETSEDLKARRAWNNLKPRMAKPLNITSNDVLTTGEIYAEGTALNLKTDDHLVFVYGDQEDQRYIRRVQETKNIFADNKTEIILQPVFTDMAAFTVMSILKDFKKQFEKIKHENENLDGTHRYNYIESNIRLGSWRNFSEIDQAISPQKNAGTLETDLDELVATFLDKLESNLNSGSERVIETTNATNLMKPLLKTPTLQPRSGLHANKNIQSLFKTDADAIPQLLVNFSPSLGTHFYDAWASANAETEMPELQSVYILRLNAPLFGYNAPMPMELVPNNSAGTESIRFLSKPSQNDWDIENISTAEMFLDNSYDAIVPGGYVLIDRTVTTTPANTKVSNLQRALLTIKAVRTGTHTAYALSGKTTHLTLSDAWRDTNETTISELRQTIVRTQSELLQLAQEPIDDDIGYEDVESEDEAPTKIELGELYPGLQAGRWLIISGERSDIPGTSGIIQSELAMLANVEQSYDENLPGDKTHSTITLEKKLAYTYKRGSVKIFANVAKATHGETRSETLGAGDASKSLQAFTLKQPPLTYVSASNPSGIESTLKVYVNDVEWHETDSLSGQTSSARIFTTKTDNEGKTTVVFGNGKEGARLPTGLENIKARYRNGIGKSGNVKADQISLLMSRPLGVKEVINPLPATGGADKETRDQARKRAPLAVKALDRLVSVKDYEDFARIFAGIGKARATELSDGQRRVVHITVAGDGDIPIAESSDLYQNLYSALLLAGDPFQPIVLAVRELIFVVISANIRLSPDYLWEPVVTQVRAALLTRFSFEARELGQDVLLGEVIATIQAVPGVDYVDVDLLRGVPEKMAAADGTRELLSPEEISTLITETDPDNLCVGTQHTSLTDPLPRICVNVAGEENGGIRPAQLAFLTPDVTSTLILNQIN
ncbi:MAG: putative baseplate assembly protein [Cellvibrio sp.]